MSDENEVTEGLVDGQTTDQVLAAEKRKSAAEGESRDQYVDALLSEREGYARYGRDDRVAEVDEQLRLRGVEPPADADGDNSRTATRRGRGKGRTVEA